MRDYDRAIIFLIVSFFIFISSFGVSANVNYAHNSAYDGTLLKSDDIEFIYPDEYQQEDEEFVENNLYIEEDEFGD